MPRLKCASALACVLLFSAPLAATPALAQAPSASGGLKPNIEGRISTPLRYHPDKGDFVIRNGAEYFNRALYGGHTAFRVDAGDKPEFSLYLPGRGGNVRLGVRTKQGVKWFNDASDIESRYRPGEMLYTIRDPLMGANGRIEIEVLSDHANEGLLLRANGRGLPKDAELVFAYGAGNGQRGARDGDIGTEKVPISEYFQFQPEYAEGTRYDVSGQIFHADSRTAGLTGTVSVPAALKLADAARWADAAGLLASTDSAAVKVVTGHVPLGAAPVYLAVQVTRRGAAEELGTYRDVTAGNTGARTETLSTTKAYAATELAARFNATRQHFAELRGRVRTETPDPYLDAAVGALNVASDGQWDERDGGGVMHGAIAWRARLLGWRGPYALDALGWHDRARQNFGVWTRKQNTKPIPDFVAPPEEKTNLARNPDGLHTNGDLSNTHYDMNIGFFDALFRHLLWTGDLEYANRVWPVIERHLAWEKRLFRREFGPEKLPLYEAYAAIWASDDMQYSGGGTAYTTAHNLYHNRMAARVARLIGKNPAPYEAEAALIERGMQTYLWMEDRGAYGEFRDYLGKQMLHPSYGVWSFYHSIDSGAPDALQAARMAADLERSLRPLPVTGEGVPNDRPYRLLPSSDWMPYSWSINNVVMGENLHTALALWQAGKADTAYDITRGGILASFFMGIAPGNVGSMNYLDVYRRESQRDFADGTGVMARTVIEGLFGVRPDALSRTLTLVPGLPPEWDHARLTHPNLSFAYKRSGQNGIQTETWTVTPADKRFDRVVLDLPARRDAVASVTINGKAAKWDAPEGVGAPKMRIEAPLNGSAEVRIVWSGQAIEAANTITGPADGVFTGHRQGAFAWQTVTRKSVTTDRMATCPVTAPGWATAGQTVSAEPVDVSAAFNDKVTHIFQPGKYRSPRSPFVSLAMPSQGIGAWAGHVNATADIDDTALRQAGGEIATVNGLHFRTPGDGNNIAFASLWDNYPDEVSVALSGQAKRAYLLMAGSTNHMQSRVTNGEVVVTYTDGTTQRLKLRNPENWWPIERDYYIDDYQFRLCGEVPVRVDLKTGKVWTPGADWKGRPDREKIDGGAASVLSLDLDPTKTLKSLTVRAVANEVIIGLMGVSLER